MKTTTIKNLIATGVVSFGMLFAMNISAEAKTYTGEAGATSTWTYDDVANTIVISGTGKTKDYLSQDFPFSHGSVKPDVIFKSGITEIGYQSFNCPIGNLDIAPSVTTIDDQAFMCSISDDELVLYAQNIGESAFTNLGGVNYIEVVNAKQINTRSFCGLTKGNHIKFDNAVSFADNAIETVNGATIELPESLNSVGSLNNNTINGAIFYGYKNYNSIDKLVSLKKADYVNYRDLYNMSNKTLEISMDEVFYTGSAIEPQVRVSYALTNRVIDIDSSNYTVAYSDNTEMGTATVTVAGRYPYTGTLTKEFTIYGDLSQAEVTVLTDEYEYDGSAKEPGVIISLYGEQLVEGVDYMLTFFNNIEVGHATITISPVSNLLKNSVEAHFEIIAPIVAEEETTTPSSEDQTQKEETSESTENVEEDNDDNDSTTDTVLKASASSDSISDDHDVEDEETVEPVVVNTKAGNFIIEDDEATFVKASKSSKVVVPVSISYEGENYKVTTIGSKAFNKKNTKIVIKGDVDFEDGALKGVAKKATIDVPNKLVKSYKNKLTSNTGYKKTMKIK